MQFLKLVFSKNRTLTLALVASLLVHILLLNKFVLTLPNLNEGRQAVEMRLVNVQAMQKATPVPTFKADKEPVAITQELPQSESKKMTNEIGNITDGTKTQDVPTGIGPIASPEVPVVPNETIKSIEPAEVTNIEIKPLPQPYHNVETIFEVYRDNHDSVAGSARVVFNISENNTYILSSVTEANGLASLFLGALVQKSEGVVLENGLRPNYYTYLYGNDDKKMQSANFAWSDGIIEMNSEKGKKTEALVAGTQDFLSFMYQFMFIPPLENTEIAMSNGKKLRTYSYSFQGEDKITSKLGELNTIHLLKSGDDDEKTELWLAIDYQYLPVKIRKTESDGSYIEQIATKISVSLP